MLVDRAGDREGLLDRDFRDRGQQRVELGRGRAVAVDAAIGLLEHQAGQQRHRRVERIAAGQQPPQDHDALGVERPTELHLSLDVHHPALPHAYAGGDPARAPEGECAELEDREPIDLPDLGAFRVDEDNIAVDDLLGPIAQPIGALNAFCYRPFDIFSRGHLTAGLA